MRKSIPAIGALSLSLALSIALCSCTPKAPEEDGRGVKAAEPAVAVDWSENSDCATCHAAEQESYSDQACLAGMHPDAACTQCHADVAALATVHEGKTEEDKMPKKLKSTDVPDELCLSCHFGSREALAQETPDILITDAKGNSRNPHLSDGISEHDDIECAECHGMHKAEPIEDQARDVCYSCHHAEVFECYTCHE